MKIRLIAVDEKVENPRAWWQVTVNEGELALFYDGRKDSCVAVATGCTVNHAESVTETLAKKMRAMLMLGLGDITGDELRPQGVCVITPETLDNIRRSPWMGEDARA